MVRLTLTLLLSLLAVLFVAASVLVHVADPHRRLPGRPLTAWVVVLRRAAARARSRLVDRHVDL